MSPINVQGKVAQVEESIMFREFCHFLFKKRLEKRVKINCVELILYLQAVIQISTFRKFITEMKFKEEMRKVKLLNGTVRYRGLSTSYVRLLARRALEIELTGTEKGKRKPEKQAVDAV